MQQAFKTMMNQSGAPQGSSPFANPAFPGGSPFPFPPMPPQGAPGPFQFSPPPAVQERREPAVTVDVSATKTETPPSSKSSDEKIEEKDEKKFGRHCFSSLVVIIISFWLLHPYLVIKLLYKTKFASP